MTELSIVILTCNQLKLTSQCLDALSTLVCDSIEVIVVDNGSADGTPDEIIRLYPWVRLLALPANHGVAAGRNIGIKASTGAQILILDNDTIPSAESIKRLAAYLDRHPECGLCAPKLVMIGGEVQQSYKPYPGLREKVLNVIFPQRHCAGVVSENVLHPDYVIGACQMVRREVLDHVGLLDENIFYGPEDADFCIRIAEAGYTIDYVPSIEMVHLWQRATVRRPFSHLTLKHLRGLLYFWAKHHRL